MNSFARHALLCSALFAAACSEQPAPVAPVDETPSNQENTMTTTAAESFQIAPGLDAKILKAGSGDIAEAGQNVVVHYTGWLFDDEAPNNRGDKFDSSVDRGQHFQFPLGAGRVIKGWDQGVAGMAVGEVRELTIAPEMGYGDRGAGSVIPPGATLVFEVELFDLQSIGGN
ncbi:MAG: FKBP-type peptidyl-prolyl cis-trans isomerase [Gammaproteobacteria bacterium]|nr:FKBP-type peptidyl-prolyl cis-trans isomerase [Gammaproteobacteria bacterium]